MAFPPSSVGVHTGGIGGGCAGGRGGTAGGDGGGDGGGGTGSGDGGGPGGGFCVIPPRVPFFPKQPQHSVSAVKSSSS